MTQQFQPGDDFDPFYYFRLRNLRRWFFSPFFKMLFLNACVNVFIWGGVVASFPYFGESLEAFLFPSVKKVQNLRSEMDQVHILQDERTKMTNILLKENDKDIKELKLTVAQLSKSVKDLQDQLAIGLQKSAVSTQSDLLIKWSRLKTAFENGDALEGALHAIDQLIYDKKDVLVVFHELVNDATKTSKPFNQLREELDALKDNVIKTAAHKGEQPKSWIGNIVEKAKEHITFEKVSSGPIVLSDKGTENTVVKAIDQALQLLAEKKYKEAINLMKQTTVKVAKPFEEWVVAAEFRLSIEERFAKLQKAITPLLDTKA